MKFYEFRIIKQCEKELKKIIEQKRILGALKSINGRFEHYHIAELIELGYIKKLRNGVWEYKALDLQGSWLRILFGRCEQNNILVFLKAVLKDQNKLGKKDIDTAIKRWQEAKEEKCSE